MSAAPGSPGLSPTWCSSANPLEVHVDFRVQVVPRTRQQG
jgi:hypothetical protein